MENDSIPAVIDYVEYNGPARDQPCCVITDGHRYWDFEECKLDGNTYYHESGGGRVEKVRLPQFVAPPTPPIPVYVRPGLRALAPIARVFPPLWRLYRRLADAPGLYREARGRGMARGQPKTRR